MLCTGPFDTELNVFVAELKNLDCKSKLIKQGSCFQLSIESSKSAWVASFDSFGKPQSIKGTPKVDNLEGLLDILHTRDFLCLWYVVFQNM
jgi:hypothetical protein